MKVIVPGVTGKQGRGALWYLLRQDDVSEIVVGARGIEQVRNLVAELGDKRLAEHIDLSNIESTIKVIRGGDVIINCAYEGYPTDENYVNLEIPAIRAALEAGVNYTNLGGSVPASEQLDLHDGFQNKGILAVLGMGELTGHLQIMAAYAIGRLNRTDSIAIKYGERDLVLSNEHSRPIAWGARPGTKGKTNNFAYPGLGATRFRYGSKSVSIEDGKMQYYSPRANPEVFSFKEPIGRMTIAQTPAPAAVSLSRSFPEIRDISFKAGGDPSFDAKVNFLRNLGFFSKDPINVQSKLVSPWGVLMTLLEQLPPETKPADVVSEARVIVTGKEAGKEVEYSLSWTRIGPFRIREDVIPSSGLCAAIVGVMVGRGKAVGTGF